MSEKLLSVAQYAERENISKQAVYKKMKSLEWKQLHCCFVDNRWFIDVDTFQQSESTIDSKKNNQIQPLIDEIERLKNRIDELETLNQKQEQRIDDLIAGWRESQRNNSLLTHRLHQLEYPEPVEVTETVAPDRDVKRDPGQPRKLFRLFFRR